MTINNSSPVPGSVPGVPVQSSPGVTYSYNRDKVSNHQKKADLLKITIPKEIMSSKAEMARFSIRNMKDPKLDTGKKDPTPSDPDPDQQKNSIGSREEYPMIKEMRLLEAAMSEMDDKETESLSTIQQESQKLQAIVAEGTTGVAVATLLNKDVSEKNLKVKQSEKTAVERTNQSLLFHNNGVMEFDKGIVEHEKGIVKHEKGIVEHNKGVVEHEKGVVEEHLSKENIADMGALTEQISTKIQHESEHHLFKNMTLYLHLKHLLNEHSSLKNNTPHRENSPETILRHQQSVHDLTNQIASIYTEHSEILNSRGIPKHEHHLHVPEILMLEMSVMEDGQIKVKGPENTLKNYSVGMRLPDGRTIGKIEIMTSKEHQAKLEEVTALLTNLHMIMALHDDTVEQEEVTDKNVVLANFLKPKDVAKSQHPEQEQAVKLLQMIAPKVLIEAFFESVRKFDKRMLDQFLEQIEEAHEIRKDSIKYFDKQSEILGEEILVKKRNPFDLRKPELMSMLNRFVRDYYNRQYGLK